MEELKDPLLDTINLKRHLPRGYIKKVATKLKRANEYRSKGEQIACSDFMISKVVKDMKYNHPIFSFVIEVIMEKKKADKETEDKLRETLIKITTL